MIIEQHVTTPPGYLSARVIMFRGHPAEEADGPEDLAVGARPEPVYERFIAQVLKLHGRFTSDDITGFSNQQISRYLRKARIAKVIRKLDDKIHNGPGAPKFVYEVAR